MNSVSHENHSNSDLFRCPECRHEAERRTGL
jgi:hypothetical protein